jgi:RNA polymerase sigma factor (sigma-70 family)
MHWLCAHQPPDCETLYRVYWKRVVHFCTTHVTSCPDGTAEEVAQDVFLAAHRALMAQHYRGDGSLGAWLFGIARNLCARAHRDISRKMTPIAIRHLERELVQLEHHVAHARHASPFPGEVADVYERLALTCAWLEREWERLSARLLEAGHCDPPRALNIADQEQEVRMVIRHSFQRLARQNPQAYTLLHMHVIKDASVRELAGWQGVSRSAVQRRLAQARTTLRLVYQDCMREELVEQERDAEGM